MKKTTALILSVLMVCTFCFSVVADDTLQLQNHEKEIKILTDLGIVNDEPLENGYVTRSMFAELVVRAMGYGDLQYNGDELSFSDVPAIHPYYDDIMIAVQAGLLRGTSETLFEPDEYITGIQAICVAVKMISYSPVAEKKGGYPSGYLFAAQEQKLMKNLNIDVNKPIGKKDLYVLLYNTLHADIYGYKSLGGDSALTAFEGQTVLSRQHGIYYVEGVVNSDNRLSLSGSPTKETNSFTVDNMEFSCETNMGQGLVGYRVTVYYKENVHEHFEALSVYQEKNHEITLISDSIADFDYRNGVYQIDSGSKTADIEIGNDYYLVYNGEYVEGSDESLMLPAYGHITFIDNDGDGIYDVLFVYEGYTLIFGGYDSYSDIVKDKSGATDKNIELGAFKYITGSSIDFSLLEKGAVLTVYKGKNRKNVRIDYSGKVVTGIINAIDDEGCAVGGEVYGISGDARFDKRELSAGMKCEAHLDAYGRIADVKVSSADLGGYLLAFDVSGGMNKTMVKIYTAGGLMRVFELADKVTVVTPSGKLKKSSAEIARMVNDYCLTKRLYVLYRFNEDKKIEKIVLPQIVTTQEEYEQMGGYPLYKMDYYIENWPNYDQLAYRQYKHVNMGFANWLILGSDTLIMNVAEESNTSFEEELFSVGSVSGTFSNDKSIEVVPDHCGNKKNGEIDVYKVGDSGYFPEVIVKFTGNSPEASYVDLENNLAVVCDVRKKYNIDEEETVTELVYTENGTTKTASFSNEGLNTRSGIQSATTYLTTSTSVGFKNPTLADSKSCYDVGDLVKFNVNAYGEISNICLLYDGKNKKLAYPAMEEFNGISRLAVGEAVVVDGTYIELKLFSSNAVERLKITDCTILVNDVGREKVYAGTLADVTVGEELAVYSRYSNNSVVVVYKNR